MKVTVILAHPYSGSLNHALARAAVETLAECGHTIYYHDLYAEEFNPVMDTSEMPIDAYIPPLVAAHVAEIVDSDGIVIIHPNWWGQPPAILKGWVDRVLRYGAAYDVKPDENGMNLPIGLLKAQTALIFTTSNTPPEREMAWFGDPLELIWKKCVFGYCGVPRVERINFSVVNISTAEERQGWIEQVGSLIRQYMPS